MAESPVGSEEPFTGAETDIPGATADTSRGLVARSGAAEASEGATGSSPYSTGAGGVTLERRVATLYLSRLITGTTAPGLNDRQVTRVAHQQAPAHHVDDLVITAADVDGGRPFELHIGVRSSPAFTTSDGDTRKLLRTFLADLPAAASAQGQRALAICVGGRQPNAEQVAQLASVARQQDSSANFYSLVQTPKKYQRVVRTRLTHVTNLVAAAMTEDDQPPAEREAAQERTFLLLNHLHILMPRVEAPDETDWEDLPAHLQPWTSEQSPAAARALRDRLEALAAAHGPNAAVLDATTLRRQVHDLLHDSRRRHHRAWEVLRDLDTVARDAVRQSIHTGARHTTPATAEPHDHTTSEPAPHPESGRSGSDLSLARSHMAARINSALASTAHAVVVSGESGVGKSALVLRELSTAAGDSGIQVLRLNLRALSASPNDLMTSLGAPLQAVLAEMSAPRRELVIDAADAVLEGYELQLRHLLRAAHEAQVRPWVVTSTTGRAGVEAVVRVTHPDPAHVHVDGLSDEDLEQAAAALPRLRQLLNQPRTKELLRRPIVIDLLMRTQHEATPLSEAQALRAIWEGLVRKHGEHRWGSPQAREQTLRRLALQQLRDSDPMDVMDALDGAAVAGLIHDGLLQAPVAHRPLPTFAHDIVRTYALTQVLLAYDVAGELLRRGAPRWTLPAARLALQMLLDAPDSAEQPLLGRLDRAQRAFDSLTQAGHGKRWADLPQEAVLGLPRAAQLLTDAWPALIAEDAHGLHRLLRVARQRHVRPPLVDHSAVDPVVSALVEQGWPARVDAQATELITSWLRSLAVLREPVDHPGRMAVREQLLGRIARADERLATAQAEHAAQLAARSPEAVVADSARHERFRRITPASRRRGRRRWVELPYDLTQDHVMEQLALLGPDLGEGGAEQLRRVAAASPYHLEAAVESPWAGYALASYNAGLLAELTEAYYIDEDSGSMSYLDSGIRHHQYWGWEVPQMGALRGPFFALFNADRRAGVRSLDRLLRHATRTEQKELAGFGHHELDDEPDDEPDDGIAGELTDEPPYGESGTGPEATLELTILGTQQRYRGNGVAWMWYRGTSVGPYPCMSALAALELACDRAIAAGHATPEELAAQLMQDSDSLAIAAMVVGMLVRHLAPGGAGLDDVLAEPAIWSLEFTRVTNETSGLAMRTEGITAPERRGWSLREVSAWLALHADPSRAEQLREVGRRLIARTMPASTSSSDNAPMSEREATVRGWAATLDQDRQRYTPTEGGFLIDVEAEREATARLAPSNEDLARGQEVVRLVLRYPERYSRHVQEVTYTVGRRVSMEELLADLAVVRDLLERPPTRSVYGMADAATAVAAALLEQQFLSDGGHGEDDLVWAATLLVEVVNRRASQGGDDADVLSLGRGAVEMASRALPLLTLPGTERLWERLDRDPAWTPSATAAVEWVINSGSNEARLFFVRGLDPLWLTPSEDTSGVCNHREALQVVEHMARGSLIGGYDPMLRRNARLHIDGAVAERLAAVAEEADETVDIPRLSPVLRGAAAASAADCCRSDALELLQAVLSAHRVGRKQRGYYQHSDDDDTAAARALLDVTDREGPSLLLDHLRSYRDHPRQLRGYLRAMSIAAEENPRRAAAASEAWPAVLEQVLVLVEANPLTYAQPSFGEDVLAAALPRPSFGVGPLHQEMEGEAITWIEPLALEPLMPRWLTLATGRHECAEALAFLVGQLPMEQQVRQGLAWVEQLVLAAPDPLVNRGGVVAEWLRRVLPHVLSGSGYASWQRIVDALTVAGDDRVATLAD